MDFSKLLNQQLNSNDDQILMNTYIPLSHCVSLESII